MKNIILIFILILPIWAFGQDYRVIDWKTDVLNVQTINTDTFKFETEIKDYNDPGAITREIGNYFIDFVFRCFKIIGSDATTITVVDLEHINMAPQSNQIGRVYQSVVDADSLFESIGGVDISVLDQMSIYRDVARNNEIICRLLKELYLKDATYRQKTDHDSLSALDEKSYNSLTDKPASLPASDVYPWAKAATKPTYTKSEVGLSNVDNTSDANKPISTATQTALNDLVPFLGADRDVDLGANSINTDTVKIDGVPLLLNTFKQGNLGGASNIFYSTGASSQPASGTVNQVVGNNYIQNQNSSAQNANFWINGSIKSTSVNLGLDEAIKWGGGYASGHPALLGSATAIHMYPGGNTYSGNVYINTEKVYHAGNSNRLDVNWNARQFFSHATTGTPPLVVASTTKVDNLNVSFLEGHPASYFETANVNIQRHITNDNDTIIDNEIQDLSRSGNTLSLSGDGTTVDLSDLVNPDLSNYATIIQLRDSIAYLKTLIPTVETTATIKTKLGIATNSTDGYLLATDWTTFNAKQATLVSGTNIKTVNSTSLLGSGNISIAPMVYPSQGLAKSNGTGWDASITDNSALWNRAVTVSDSLKNDVLDTSSVNINKPNWTKFIQSVTAVQGIPKVGDYYGGGQVYYVSPSGTYGYCVYPSVIATNTYWSPTNNSAAIATNQAVGAGIANTTAIVAVFGAGNYAAYKVDTLNIGGYSDWALPSAGDADLIHDSLYSAFPTSNPTYYLCSNDAQMTGYGYVWSSGSIVGVNKGTSGSQPELYGVIAVRRFVISTQSFNLSVSESDGSPSYSAINSFQFANCTVSQPTSNTVLVTPTTGSSMTGDQIVTALNTTTSVNLTKPLYSTELGMNGTGYNYFWSQYYDDAYHYGVYLAQSPKGSYSRELRYDASDNILYVPRINLENGGYVNSIGTGAATGSSTTKLVTEDMLAKSIQASGGGDMSRSVYDVDVDNIVDNSEKLGGQLPSYYMPNVAAGTGSLGGIQVSSTDGGLAMSGNYLLQKDNVLTARTPVVSDEIAFYDISAAAQGKMTLSTLGSLIGGSGGSMVYPGAGIPVSTGSAWGTSKTAPSGAIVGTTDSQSLTNKSVNGVTLSTSAGATNFLAGDGTYKASTYTLPIASSSGLGGVKVNGNGIVIDAGGVLFQEDNNLTVRTPILSDPIAFYDASATAQGKTTFAEIRTIMNGVQTLTSASSITMNFATAPKATLSLATNGTITITNVPDGGEGSIEVTSSGAYTLAIAGSTGYTTTQKMGTVSAIASTAHTTVFYWRSGSTLYYGFLLNN